jgi:enoyl-CoA hydratase/carnithine racemase
MLSSVEERHDMTTDEAASGTILSLKEGAIGWLVFSNPKRLNAVSLEMWRSAGATLEDYARDDTVRVVIVRGAGDKAFTSGGDVSRFDAQRSTAESRASDERVRSHARQLLATLDKPTIAMIRGWCLGGGLGWALHCDLRICGDDAVFALPAARMGTGYGADGIRQLTDVVGPAAAKEILFTGRQYDAQEALRLGLVNRVVPAAELESYTRAYAEDIAANAPLAVLNAKTAVNELVKDPADRDMAKVARRADDANRSDDYVEGRRAFMEKRKPVFKGR